MPKSLDVSRYFGIADDDCVSHSWRKPHGAERANNSRNAPAIQIKIELRRSRESDACQFWVKSATANTHDKTSQ
jgi:hypothetical protein